MVWNGIVGVFGGVVGWKFDIRSDKTFIEFWSAIAVLAIVGSFLLVRRQALKDSEPFWSPPTRRVAQALCPPLFIGGFVNAIVVYLSRNEDFGVQAQLIAIWLWLYGCAACSAGFFMTRGIKLFGWLFIIIGCAWVVLIVVRSEETLPMRPISGSLVMGLIFGGFHLAYGIYLYLTEKGKNAA